MTAGVPTPIAAEIVLSNNSSSVQYTRYFPACCPTRSRSSSTKPRMFHCGETLLICSIRNATARAIPPLPKMTISCITVLTKFPQQHERFCVLGGHGCAANAREGANTLERTRQRIRMNFAFVERHDLQFALEERSYIAIHVGKKNRRRRRRRGVG